MKKIIWKAVWCVIVALPGAAMLWIRDRWINTERRRALNLKPMTFIECYGCMVWFQGIDNAPR